MDTRDDSHGRRVTLADFEGIDVVPVLKANGQTLEAVLQMELDYAAAEKQSDEPAKKRLNARLQPIYQKLASLHSNRASGAAEPPRR